MISLNINQVQNNQQRLMGMKINCILLMQYSKGSSQADIHPILASKQGSGRCNGQNVIFKETSTIIDILTIADTTRTVNKDKMITLHNQYLIHSTMIQCCVVQHNCVSNSTHINGGIG